MKKTVRLKSFGSLFATVLALPLLGAGCSEDNPLSDVTGALCCDEFKVGADLSGVDFGLEGEVAAEFRAFAQASSDLSAVATATLEDVRISCENLARDLNADPAGIEAAETKSGEGAVTAWCDLARAQISGRFSGGGDLRTTLKIEFQPPVCTVQAHVAANCQANCKVDASCDLNAEMPTCEGGKLTVECGGSCTAEANAAVSCTGSCTGECSGSCTARANAAIECEGRCDGTCTATANGTESGVQADGTCMGFCQGTCTPPEGMLMASCEGTCEGSCQGTCEAQGSAKFTCDGECDGTFEAPKCEGGKLEFQCQMDAECKANCETSASAKAECRPPSVNVVASTTGSVSVEAQAEIDAAIASIRANVPALLVAVRARGEAFVDGIAETVRIGGQLAGRATSGELSGQAVGCAPVIFATLQEAQGNFTASFTAAGRVTQPLIASN